MAITKFDLRQSELRQALSMVGSAAKDTADTLFPKIDAELAKLFEDRNVILTDGGTITFTGTQLQFTENLNIVLNSKISGAGPQIISLGSANVNLSNGDIWYAVLNRSAGTVTTSVASSLPAVTSANQEVFLIVKRVDAGDGTQRVYWRSGMAMNAGQSVRLGASGSGSGSGTGDDLDSLMFRASFADLFSENASNVNSGINPSGTNASYNAAKTMYVMSYDASKTITTAGTAATISGAPGFTVAVGDVVYLQSTGEVKKITAVASQTSYTLESAFAANQTAAAATISQAVHTKDIYNLVVDGAAISAAFGAATFSEVLVDYKDSATSGSNVFTPNVTPVVAFIASPDNSSWTTLQNRATNETDIASSTFLPSAGTALYFRFFAAKTSGSGTVNLINYKAFMQKSTVTASGGVFNAAYAFTNNVGTPVNCAVSVVGGKTTISLTFQYAVGVNTGLPYGSLDVYVNGQLIPRFINSTLTPDASYVETSGKILTLDKDYSAQNLSVEILQRVQILDASTTNTTAIAAIQEASNFGFQAFVNTNNILSATSTAGTPAVGKFYSTITNRAGIVDITQDLKARMGIDRTTVQQIYQLQNEFGPNGEVVSALINDDRGMVRFVGNWTVISDTNGYRATTVTVGDYTEITFYGTGFNILGNLVSSADYRASIDGGSEGSNLLAASYSTVISSRNYNNNQVLPVVNGLTLGVHTVKIRNNSSNGINFAGYEILNESSLVKVNPGVSYVAGTKLVSTVQSSFAYNSPASGVRGGRVLVYQNSDGTIGSAFQAVNSSSATLASADHTNEEIARVHHWREFGANRSDDFSTLTTSSSSRSFALDDGSASLVTSGGLIRATSEVLTHGANGDYFSLTFIGTGLDIIRQDQGAVGSSDTYTLQVDGASAVNFPTTGSTSVYQQKLVSGLPYGTHIVRINRSTGANWNFGIKQFIVYQPKKPTLPSGANELGDYNAMADFSGIGSAGVNNISTGVLRKSSLREAVYVGTWSVTADFTSNIGGIFATTSTANSYFEYTFFGTGFEYRAASGNGFSSSIEVRANGSLLNSTNFPTASFATLGTGTGYNSSTAILDFNDASTTIGACFRVTGLTLGKYTVRLTTTSAQQMTSEAFDIITPIHSVKSNLFADFQNTLPVGSCGISDNRKFSAIKESLSISKFRGIATGNTTVTTTSTAYVPLPDMSMTVKSSGNWFEINWQANLRAPTTASDQIVVQPFVNGSPVGASILYRNIDSTASFLNQSNTWMIYLPVGTHKIDMYWLVAGSTAECEGSPLRVMTVKEL